jgi:DNA-binding winged helix-turn-helix (wHTH) protein/TolB-like protein/tetratricopeptide (TPR) repeat protein
MQPVSKENELSYQFDAFELDPVRRVLLREDKAIALKPKVFETLLVLVRNSGRVMDKDELMQQVWPDTVVEEVNLAHNISVLRKALGQKADENRFIITVPGRGYGFVAEVKEIQRNATVSEYEVTRSRLVVEEATDEREVSDALPTYADGAGARLLPAKKPKSNWAQTLPRRRLIFAAALVVVAMAIALGLLIYRSRPSQPQPFARITSIAVLPFKPLVAENRDESLELGMADTLIARLSNIREISVRPISAVRRYAGLEQDAVAAGREQRVDAVIDGQIQKSGEKIRVTVRLVRVADGVPMWTNQFDENMSDIFRVQDSISERVTGVLALKLTGEEKERLARNHTDNTEAYQLYLKGRYFWNKRTGDAIKTGIDYFSQAVEADPDYALAYAGLAEAYVLLANYSDSTPQEAYSKARAATTKALKLNDRLAETHTALAYIKAGYDWDFAGAEREYQRALELNPNYPTAQNWYAEFLGLMGRSTESITGMRRALELEPLSLMINVELGDMLLFARQYDQAIEQYRKTLDLDSSFVRAHVQLGQVYGQKGQYEEAISELKKAISLNSEDNYAIQLLGYMYAISRRTSEAYKALEELKERAKRTHVLPYDIAVIYVGLGEKDRAFEWLEKSFAERDEGLLYLRVDPVLDSLRSDPRFADLLRRVGFPQ